MATETKNTKPFYKTEIPNDWEIKILGECCLVKGEYGINAPAVDFSDDLPAYLRITDIDDYGNYSNDKKASVGDPNYQQFILKNGDIVFARTGATVGKTYLYRPTDGILVFAGFLIRFRTNEKLLIPQHLKYFTETKHYWDWVKTVSMRSGQPGINAEEYASLKIPLPPLTEQLAISQILSTSDAAIQTTEKLIAQKELRKKWLMQQLLTGKKRLKGFGGEWKEIKLGDIGEIKTSSVDKVLLEGEKIVNLVNYMDVYRNRFISPEFECKKTSANEREINTFNLRKGDILFTPSSETPDDIGHSAVVTADLENTVYSYHLVRFRLFQETALAYNFRAYVFNNQNILNEFSRRATGSTRFTISKSDFEEIKTEIPPSLEEQTAIAQVLQAADKEITLLKAKVDKLREQKKGLMQVLLTGKVRLKID